MPEAEHHQRSARGILPRLSIELPADLVEAQIASTIKAYPLTFAVTLVVTVAILVRLHGLSSTLWLHCAVAVQLVVGLAVLHRWWRTHAAAGARSRSARAARTIVAEAAAVAGAWMFFLLTAARQSGADELPLVTTVIAGVIAVGALRYAAVPAAGLAFLSVSAAGIILSTALQTSLMPFEVVVFLAVFVGMLARAVLSHAKLIIDQFEVGTALAKAAGERDVLIAKAQEEEWRAKAGEAAAMVSVREQAEQQRLAELGDIARQFQQLIETTALGVSESALQARHSVSTIAESSITAHQQVAALAGAAALTDKSAAAILDCAEVLERALEEVSVKIAEQRITTEQMYEVSRRTGDDVQSLTGLAADIKSISSTIQSIAHRTDLLALNAAIEASRAGQAGRGFSVVATEVKALATQTAEATASVEGLVEEIGSALGRTGLQINDLQNQFSSIGSVAAAVESAVQHQNKAVRAMRASAESVATTTNNFRRTAGLAETASEEAARLAREVDNCAAALLAQSNDLTSGAQAFISRLR